MIKKRIEAGEAIQFSSIKLSIVCPMANERDTAEKFIYDVINIIRPFRFKQLRFFVIIDKVSQDGTIKILKALEDKIFELVVVYAPLQYLEFLLVP